MPTQESFSAIQSNLWLDSRDPSVFRRRLPLVRCIPLRRHGGRRLKKHVQTHFTPLKVVNQSPDDMATSKCNIMGYQALLQVRPDAVRLQQLVRSKHLGFRITKRAISQL